MLTSSSSFSLVSLYMSHFEAESLSGGLASQNQHRGEFGFSCDMFTSLSVGVRSEPPALASGSDLPSVALPFQRRRTQPCTAAAMMSATPMMTEPMMMASAVFWSSSISLRMEKGEALTM